MQNDQRIAYIRKQLKRFLNSDYLPGEFVPGKGDEIDEIIKALNALGLKIHKKKKRNEENQEKINTIIDKLLDYAGSRISEDKADLLGDENDAIAAGLDVLVKEIAFSYEKLRESERLHHKMVEDVDDYAIILLDPKGVIQNWNKGAWKIKGYTAKEAIGKNFNMFYTEKDRLDGKPARMIAKASRYGKSSDEGWRVRRDGTTFQGSITITALHNEAGAITGFTKVTRDLTLIKEKEKKLEERAAQLQAVNRELESFSYSVSHDLRAPLRAIHGYSQILLEDYGDKLDEDGPRIVNTIMNNAKMMGTLIDDLLTFSRLGKKELKRTNLNTRELVENVIMQINESMDHKADITLGSLPDIYADPGLINQVYHNLIFNAIKFSSKKENPKIHIGSEETKNGLAYYVKDNGVGFDMKYYDKLFDVFQRLHRADEFEGTGVGLPIVMRIILRHGGKVWGKGSIDKGAVFYFTVGNPPK